MTESMERATACNKSYDTDAERVSSLESLESVKIIKKFE